MMQKFSPSITVDETGEATRIARTGLIAMSILVGVFYFWSILVPISGAVVADGIIKVATNRKTIQHLEGGTVKEILVKEGDMVKQGQPLIQLEDTKASSDFNALSDQRDVLLAKQARLQAESTLAANINFPADLTKRNSAKVRDLIAKETAVFRARRKLLDDQTSLLQAQLEQTKHSSEEVALQIQAIQENIRYAEEQLAMRESLLQKNFVGKTDVLNFKQTLTEKKETLAEQGSVLSMARERIDGLQVSIASVRNQYVQDANTELKDTLSALLDTEEKLRPAREVYGRQVIVAPLAGQVIDLKVTTLGGVIKPGDALMDIVPETRDLILEVKVKNTDIDSVHLNQEADVQLSAYNRRTTPLVKGKVIYVSGDVLEENSAPATGSTPGTGSAPATGSTPGTHFYLAHIRVAKDAVANLKEVKLEPGMPVTAFIKTQDRTLSEYLASPIIDRTRRSFREK